MARESRPKPRCTVAVAFLLALLTILPAHAERLALVADLNGRYGSTAYHDRVAGAAAAIVAARPTLVISAGDMVAGQAPGGLEDPHREAMWNAFSETFIAPLAAAKLPLAVTVGNHDGSAYPGFEADRDAFERHWTEHGPPPGVLPGSEWPWRYALRQGELLAITFDGTLPGAVPSRDRTFVARMLESHGPEAGWTVVFSHLPFWPLARNREREIIDDEAFLALLHRHGVDAYVSGHHHLFYAGLDDAGLLHVSVAALGGNARRFASGGDRQPHGFVMLERHNGALRVHSRTAPGFHDGVDVARLPSAVDGPTGRLRRVDGPVPLRD